LDNARRAKSKPEAYATFAPRPPKQKTVGKAVRVSLFFVLGVFMTFYLRPYRKQTVGEQILPPASKRQAGGCAPGLSPSAFVRLDHAALHAPDLRMMRQHVHASVAPAKKCTKQPAYD